MRYELYRYARKIYDVGVNSPSSFTRAFTLLFHKLLDHVYEAHQHDAPPLRHRGAAVPDAPAVRQAVAAPQLHRGLQVLKERAAALKVKAKVTAGQQARRRSAAAAAAADSSDSSESSSDSSSSSSSSDSSSSSSSSSSCSSCSACSSSCSSSPCCCCCCLLARVSCGRQWRRRQRRHGDGGSRDQRSARARPRSRS